MAFEIKIDTPAWIKEMRLYIEEQKLLSPEQTRKEAFEDLYASGVIDEKGRAKKNIVSWAQNSEQRRR